MRQSYFYLGSVLASLFSVSAVAETKIVPKDKSAYERLIGNKKGGTAYVVLAGNPKTLNGVLDSDSISARVGMIYTMGLFETDPDTLDFLPALAKSVTISDDKKVYTFELDPDAKWDDGTPFTAYDYEFTYNLIMDPKVEAGNKRPYFDGVKLKVLDKYKLQFTVDVPKFNTLRSLVGIITPIQKSVFEKEKDFNNSPLIYKPTSVGPYKFKEFNRDQSLIFERKKDWWGNKFKWAQGMFNADTIYYRIIKDQNLQYERLLKGEIDYLSMKGDLVGTKVKGVDKDKFSDKPGEGKLAFLEHVSKSPGAYSYIGWNLRKPLFKSVKVRQALARLIDIPQIIEKVYYGYGIQSTSPFGSLTQNSAPELRQPGKILTFDRKEAIRLLKEDGWKDSDGDNILDKVIDGQKVDFKFVLKTNSENERRKKMAQIIKESMKAAGIEVTIQAMEFNALLEDKDERKFDAILLGWTGTNFPDPKQIWHSSSEANKGSNFIAYSNPKVDELIEKANVEFDEKKRALILQDINRILYEEQPYAFLVEENRVLMGIGAKVKSKVWGFERVPTASYDYEFMYSYAE